MVIFPFTISAQNKLTDKKVKEIIENMESNSVDIIKVKIVRKYKALNLSKNMRSQMDYDVVKVKYKIDGNLKTAIIDRHLVPINYDFRRTIRDTENTQLGYLKY
jgi:hypothetical protein